MEEFMERCRLCLQHGEGVMVSRIEELPPVFTFQLDPDCSLPVNVCRECFGQVEDYYSFSNAVLRNQEKLRELHAQLKTEFIPVEEIKEESPYETDAIGAASALETEDNELHMSQVSAESYELTCQQSQDVGTIVSNTSKDLEIEEIDHELVANQDHQHSEDEYDEPHQEQESEESAEDTLDKKCPKKTQAIKSEAAMRVQQENEMIADYFQLDCELCSHRADNFVALKKHYRVRHNRSGYVRCCERKLFKRCDLLEHQQVHLNPKQFACDLCGKQYRSKEYLQRHHQQAHDSSAERKFKCSECHRSFLHRFQLNSHLVRHVKAPCPQCDKILSSKAALGIHMQKIHSTEGRMICDTCGREFRTKLSFTKHVQQHQGTYVPEQYRCDYCSALLASKVSLKKHILVKHKTTDEEYVCTKCNNGKRYPNKLAFDSHKRKVHVEKKHACDFCGRGFKDAKNLREHRAVHSGEDLYRCEHCTVAFKWKSNMYAHTKKQHPDEWAAAKRKAATIVYLFEMTDRATLVVPDSNTVFWIQSVSEIMNDEQCRLCLERCTPGARTSIEDAAFRQISADVFSFAIETLPTLPKLVCTACFDRINDFHVYSVQVRTNQEFLVKHSTEKASMFEMVKVQGPMEEQMLELEVCASDIVEEKKESVEVLNEVHDPTVQGKTHNQEDDLIRAYYDMKCEICSTELDTFAKLQRHFKKEHSERGYVRCCEKVLTKRSQVLEHIRMHEGSLRCNLCQKSYKCNRTLELHKLIYHGKQKDKPFKCDKCHQAYPKQHLLTAHLQRHVQEQCTVCRKTLSNYQALKVHMAQMHGRDNQQICATCGVAFRTKLAMERHIKEHRGEQSIEKVQCHICSKWFNGKSNVKKHIRFIHAEQGQEFQCEICLHKYPNTRALIYHKQRVHVEEKFGCEYCGKRFKRKIYLKEHIASHTGQPLYSCEACGATFNSNGNLYAHRRTKHPTEKKEQKAAQTGLQDLDNLSTHNQGKMKEKCRLCLTLLECGDSISLSDSDFYTKLATLFQFSILVDNALPNQVCFGCQTSVNSFYTFHQDVEANQMLLLALQNDKDPIANFLPESRVEECVVEILQETPHNDDDNDEDDEEEKEEDSASQLVEYEQDVDIRNNDDSLDNEALASGDDGCSEKANLKTEIEATSQEVVAVAREGEEEVKPRRRGRPPGKRNSKKSDSPAKKSEPKKQSNDSEKEGRIAEYVSLECELCLMSLDSFIQLQIHYREAHNTAGYVRCCNKQFFRRYLLLDHIAAHIGTIRCEICQKTYKSSRYLGLHMAKAHGSEEDRPYKCEVCHLSFPKTYLLKTHQTLHVRKQCHLCKKVLSSQQSLKVHLAQMHSDDNQQICAICGKVFRTKQAMERHIKEHRGEQLVDRMQCEYCKKWFNGKYNLRKHIRFIHNEDGQVFRCDICQHESPNSRALQNHKQRIHVEEKFQCTYCGKRFKRKPSLREHMASHTGKPLYSCEICGITFNSKANRFSHRKNKHPVEWEANKRLKEQRELSKN
ncbi:zinc finger protein 845-like [Anopheles albimanus]|uniref:zinc finger protein 845-like n=1 Tax=Anopheles albimanus TaxID=7167 RepID=UPI00164109A3|nr:zinc finger protein 845-like [Anopheles albimanus]